MSAVRVVVIGAGVYGWGCAVRLAELDAAVTVVDPRPVGDTQRASGGMTRVLRFEYGAEGHYSELTLRARARWREIEATTGVDLYREVGVLFLVPDGADGGWERASLATTVALGVGGAVLDAADVARRWPAIRPGGIDWGVFNENGGILWANRATATIAGLAHAAGVTFVQERAVASDAGGVTLASGVRIDADVVVLATGAWTAGLTDVPIRPTRQLTVYLVGGPVDIPVLGDGAAFAMYGLPAHDGLGMKIGAHLTGSDGDPDDPRQRSATTAELAEVQRYATTRFGLAPDEASIDRADVCFYAMTPTEAPIVDRLPDGRVLCAGFSGHGFKFAPVVAAAAAELALGRVPSTDLSPFRLPTGP